MTFYIDGYINSVLYFFFQNNDSIFVYIEIMIRPMKLFDISKILLYYSHITIV